MNNLNIIQINDVHGYIKEHEEYFYEKEGLVFKKAGGYACIKTIINNTKATGPTLVFDGGDPFHGTYPVVKSKGEVLIPILNNLELDAMTGHWDFTYGQNTLFNLQIN